MSAEPHWSRLTSGCTPDLFGNSHNCSGRVIQWPMRRGSVPCECYCHDNSPEAQARVKGDVMTSAKRTLIFVGVVIALFLAYLAFTAFANAPANGKLNRSPIYPSPSGELTRTQVPVAMVSNTVEDRVPGDCGKRCQKRLNKVDHRKRIRTPLPTARGFGRGGGEGCRAYEDAWNAYNPVGALLYSITLRMKWCWDHTPKPGKFTAYVHTRDFWPANQWWNQWKLVRWHPAVTGHGCNSNLCYRYLREVADVESCFAFSVAGCWFHQSPYLTETNRTDGSNSADGGVA